MALLKKRSKRVGFKFIGANIPPWVHEYLTLYSVAYSTSKSALYKDVIEDWIIKERIREPDDILLRKLIDRIKTSIPDGMGLKEYKEFIYRELTENGLKESYINLVLSEIV